MKQAYSNIYGLVIDASEVEYGDCETFHIVCRECREYVFKSVRQHDRGAIHYFSHFRLDPEANAHCEERAKTRGAAKALTEGEREEHDQILAHYLENFTGMLDSLPYFNDRSDEMRQPLTSNRSYAKLRNTIRQMYQQVDIEEMVRLAASGDDNVENENEYTIYKSWDEDKGWKPKTVFSRSVQIRAASDMLRTILTKPGIPAWNTLYASAWMLTAAQCLKTPEDSIYYPYRKHLGPVYHGAMTGRNIRDDLARVAITPCAMPFMRYGETWLEKLNIEVTNTLIEILLSIDYATWANKRETGRDPTEVSLEMREAAIARYEAERQMLIAAGVDLTPETTEKQNAEAVERIQGIMDPAAIVGSAMSRVMTGEGVMARRLVEVPYGDEPLTLQNLFVRPRKAGLGVKDIRRAMSMTMPVAGDIEQSVGGTPNCALQPITLPYALIAQRLEALASNPHTEEATALVHGNNAIYMIHASNDKTVVEHLVDVVPE